MVMVLSNNWVGSVEDSTTGFWGAPSAHNFCEQDYRASSYVAELHNAYSNLLYVLVAIASLNLALQHRLPRRIIFLAGVIGLMGLTGIGCHTTLHKYWRMANELAQAWLLITLYWCRGCPYRGAAGFP